MDSLRTNFFEFVKSYRGGTKWNGSQVVREYMWQVLRLNSDTVGSGYAVDAENHYSDCRALYAFFLQEYEMLRCPPRPTLSVFPPNN